VCERILGLILKYQENQENSGILETQECNRQAQIDDPPKLVPGEIDSKSLRREFYLLDHNNSSMSLGYKHTAFTI
jgi:hypothetical protein